MNIIEGVPFSLAMIDPPYPKKKGGSRESRPNQTRRLDYKTMPLECIWMTLDKDIFRKMTDSPTVFMWTIDEFIADTEERMRNRGYKLHARIIWNKMNGVAPAFTVRYSHEYLLWLYKSPMMKIDESMRGKLTTVWEEKSREHSRKPEIAYSNIEAMFPRANKIDVFSRQPRDGWSGWGDQVDYFSKKEI